MNTEYFRKYIDIITENSNSYRPSENSNSVFYRPDITDNNIRDKVIYAMGNARYYIGQYIQDFIDPEVYEKKPHILKNALNQIRSALSDVVEYGDRKTGLYANQPNKEYRMINDAPVNTLVHATKHLYKLIDNKQVDELKNLLITAEDHLLQTAQAIHTAMGGRDKFTSYLRK